MRIASSPTQTPPPGAAPLLPTDRPLQWLGGLTPAQFMKRHWQRKPLLVRQAMPDYAHRFASQDLCELACEDDSEARLIRRQRGRWRLDTGPFEPEDFDALPRRDWTVLIQGVNLVDDAAHALLDRFRFLPSARLDDVMISLAAPGGGVGPHFDSYDVFLLQVEGRRRWRIGAQKDLSLKPGVPLKILADFQPETEYILEPGDMLYLPPRYAHDGTAIDRCVTASVGFRAPSLQELQSQCLFHLAERLEQGPRKLYQDSGEAPTAMPGALPSRMVSDTLKALQAQKWDEDAVSACLGAYLSEPKANVFFDGPKAPLSLARFLHMASRAGVVADRKSILLYDARRFYINGESLEMTARLKNGLRRLADQRHLDGTLFVTIANDSSMVQCLHEWYLAGWISVA